MKTVHDKLVIKVNAIDTSEFVLKTHLQIRSRKKNDEAGKKYLILMGCKKNQIIMLKSLIKFLVKHLVLVA